MLQTLFSVVLWIYWVLCFFIYFLVVSLLYLLTFPFDRFNQIPNKALKGLGNMMIRGNPGWKVIIKGADPGKVQKPTLVVANHQSFLDMPLTYLLPWSMKWVAKKSLFKIPILGWIIYMTGHIGIDRHSRRSVKKLDKLVEPIRRGIPGMIFPEGTRTADGSLRAFKNGAFVLAKQYNFQILPVVLNGGYDAMPQGSWKFNFKQMFTISVLNPVDPSGFESTEELKSCIHSQIEQELTAIRN